jgi:hypothetical protein
MSPAKECIMPVEGSVIYAEDFDGPLGSAFPGWAAMGYTYSGNGMEGRGVQPVTNVAAPNGEQFLGEFGGPKIVGGRPFVRVLDGVSLTLEQLPPHASVTLAFDLLILKSWDGNSPQYGPDRFQLRVVGGPILLDTSFSNNHKIAADGSRQDYPTLGSAPQTDAAVVNRLGYRFFGDSIYQLHFTFAHDAETLVLEFTSDMYEGKGTDDESWGLGHVRVSVG